MASAWVESYKTPTGATRHRVRYRTGGRESALKVGGVFKTKREASARRDWVAGELASMRVPNLRFVEPSRAEAFAAVAERWRVSRIDVKETTRTTHSVNLGRLLPLLGTSAVDMITAPDVAETVARLHDQGLKRETLRKTLATLAMVLDFAGVEPNPARDKKTVKLPQEDRPEVDPPIAAHVLAVYHLLAPRNRLPALVLDATGMRIAEAHTLRWKDIDERENRWRVSRTATKTAKARWVPVVPTVFHAVCGLVPREDRDLDAPIFRGFDPDAFRTAITRACKATGTPGWSPHALRHRRGTLWHLQGVPPVQAAAWLGHSVTEYLRTYAHATMTDVTELDYVSLVPARDRLVLPSVFT